MDFDFDESCRNTFDMVKEKLVTPPDWELPFEIMCDASDKAIGVVSGQRKERMPHVIYYASRMLDDA